MNLRIFCTGFMIICWFAGVGKASCGTIVGHVVVREIRKPKRPTRYHLGPYRSARRVDSNRKNGPQDVVISLEGEGSASVARAGVSPLRMRQENETFIPHVLPIQVGTTVEFPNEDEFYHNVFSVMSGDRFDLGRYAKGSSAREVFEKPGIVVVRCEIHAGMKAYVVVLDTPYFTVPDETGAFALKNIPAGSYKLRAWHPSYGEQEQTVLVTESGSVSLDIAF